MKRGRVTSVNVSGFGHIAITNKNSPEMVSETFGVWFLSPSQLQRLLSDLINRTTMWLSPGPPADWLSLLSSGPQLPTMHGGLWGFLWSRTQTTVILKANQRTDKTLGVLLLTGWSPYQCTTKDRSSGIQTNHKDTCGRRMETLTHLLLFVAIDTCVYPFKWGHQLAAAETWLSLN